MEQLTANVFVETGFRGCNPSFVTTREGIVMIDSPYRPSDAAKWRQEIARRGQVVYLINTEPHADHWMGNHFFAGRVVAHEGVREALNSIHAAELVERVRDIDPEGLPLMKDYQVKMPAITFTQRLHLYLGDHDFVLLNLPGHTASQTAVFVPQEKVVFTGDNVFCRVQAFFQEAYPDQWLKSLRKIGQLKAEKIVPGHGPVCDKGYLAEQASFIREWIEAVKKALSQGMSKEEAISRISFLDRYPMDIGLEARGPEVQRMNVARLYDLLAKGG